MNTSHNRRILGILLLFSFLSVALPNCSGKPVSPITLDSELSVSLRNYSVAMGYQAGTDIKGTGMRTPYPGLILTNEHVVANNDSTQVTLDGRSFLKATVIHRNKALDLALVKLDGSDVRKDFPPTVRRLAPGIPVIAFGSAFGLEQTYMQGFVSHEGRSGLRGYPEDLELIQVQHISYAGMSGAPIFTLDGQWVGLNRAAYGYSATTGTGLIVPADLIKEWMAAVLD